MGVSAQTNVHVRLPMALPVADSYSSLILLHRGFPHIADLIRVQVDTEII